MELKKIEKVYFYNSSHRDIIYDIAVLTEKLFLKNDRIVIFCTDQETVEVVDNFLWAYREDSFIPHSINRNEKTLAYPILITSSIDEGYEHDVLLVLNGVLIKEKDWQKFNKIYYFFDDQDNKEKENARAMWKSCSSLNAECKYWVNEKNKWVLANSR
ncbi:MAG: DNA polymerase III subunit chi [Paracoccaceae bacterium]